MTRARYLRNLLRGLSRRPTLALLGCLLCASITTTSAQTAAVDSPQALAPHTSAPARARRFTASRTLPSGASAARALSAARAANDALAQARTARILAEPRLAGLGAAWTPAGPPAIQSLHFGAISGRVTSLALDPGDPTGNTLFVGTAGGGVWRSTNAAGPPSAVTITPLTDTLPVFSPSAGSSATASLSIGALLALPGGLVLAGTGDPNDSADSLYGSGLLRSADFGATWSLIPGSQDGTNGNHSFFGLGFAGFAASSATPSLIVAAVSQSAEGVLRDATARRDSVMGLYYSPDAGVSWRMATLLDGSAIVQSPMGGGANNGGIAATSVVWNPVRQRFIAAVRYHGYYQSADGATWTRLPNQPGAGLTTIACPALAANPACPIFRGVLAVDPVSGDTFALTVDLHNADPGLFRDRCAGSGSACATSVPTFSQQLPSSPLETGTAPATILQADYNLALAALPTGTPGTPSADTLLYVGTSDLFRCSVAAGCTLRNTTNAANGCAAPAGVAPAQHAIALGGPASAPVLFLGNDGGLWRSTDTVNQQATSCSADDAAHFQNLNLSLGSLAEVVSFAQHPTDPAILLAGLGASGTVSTARADSTAWQQLASGEGGTVAIDPSNPSRWYLSTGAGVSIVSCGDGDACTPAEVAVPPAIGSAHVGGDLALLDAPWLLDPAQPESLLAGTCRLWRGPATSGALWSASNLISPMLTGPQSAACTANNGFIQSLGTGGPANGGTGSSVIYAGLAGTLAGGGYAGGHLFASPAPNAVPSGAPAQTPWIDLAASPVTDSIGNRLHFNPSQFSVSSVTADPHDATGKTVYATIQGFSTGLVITPHVYQSLDGGAHWMDISANLPLAPVNALVVDPNDANTVYVALDTGVYATRQIATCFTTNCWSLFGAALPNSPVTTLAAAAALPAADGRLGMLRAGTAGRGLWQIPLLTAATVAQPAMLLSPASLDFPAQAVGTASIAQTIVVTNSGTAPLTVASVAISSGNPAGGVTATVTDFQETTTCTAAPIAPGAECSLAVAFLPSAAGRRVATLTLYGNVPGGQATASLSGTATPPAAVQLSPTALAFSATSVGGTSSTQIATLANTGGTTVGLSAVSVSGADFQLVTNTCGTALAPATACGLAVAFHPAALGARTGLLTVIDALGTQTVALSGVATAPATDSLSTVALTFPTTQTGTLSAPQQLILTNAGDVALALISTSLASSDFLAVNGCGNSLAPHAACTITVTYQPHGPGAAAASLLVADEFRTRTVALSGTGIAPPGVSLLPANTMSFPATGIGQTSLAQTLTLTNNGGLPLLLQSVTLTGDFALATTGGSCGVALAPGTACTLSVVFSPVLAGARTGSITLVDNAPSPQLTVPLSGTAVDFSLGGDGPLAATVSSGKSASFPLLVSSAASTPGSATLACTGAPANSTCTLSPAVVSLGSTTAVIVTLNTGISTPLAAAPPPLNTGSQAGKLAWLAALLPLGMLALRQRRGSVPKLLALTLAALLPLGLGGCAGTPRQLPGAGTPGSPTPGPSITPTPPGTYALTVTATSAGLSRAVTLSLTVQ